MNFFFSNPSIHLQYGIFNIYFRNPLSWRCPKKLFWFVCLFFFPHIVQKFSTNVNGNQNECTENRITREIENKKKCKKIKQKRKKNDFWFWREKKLWFICDWLANCLKVVDTCEKQWWYLTSLIISVLFSTMHERYTIVLCLCGVRAFYIEFGD